MVHALEEIERLLKPDGRLVDIHPTLQEPSVEVIRDGRSLFSETRQFSAGDQKDIELAEDALAQVLRRGIFEVEAGGGFDYRAYFPSAAGLLDYVSGPSGVHETLQNEAEASRDARLIARIDALLQTAGEGAEAVYREKIRITRLRPVRG